MTSETKYDFQDGSGPVSAHRHSKGGGWVADTAYVDLTAYVGPDACVYGNAKVGNTASVFDNASVFGNAKVFGNASVFGSVIIDGLAEVFDYACVFGNAKAGNTAQIYSRTRVCGNAVVTTSVLNANRSDGYTFTIFDEVYGTTRITAGCRFFTIPEAIEHWTKTRGDTKLGRESIALVKHLEYAHSLKDMKEDGIH